MFCVLVFLYETVSWVDQTGIAGSRAEL